MVMICLCGPKSKLCSAAKEADCHKGIEVQGTLFGLKEFEISSAQTEWDVAKQKALPTLWSKRDFAQLVFPTFPTQYLLSALISLCFTISQKRNNTIANSP